MRLVHVHPDPPTKENQKELRFECGGCDTKISVVGDDIAYVDLEGPLLETHFYCVGCVEMWKLMARELAGGIG